MVRIVDPRDVLLQEEYRNMNEGENLAVFLYAYLFCFPHVLKMLV